MGQDNTVPRRINRGEGVAGQVMKSAGPGNVEVWGMAEAGEIRDTDGDTGIRTEQIADEDQIRGRTAGTECLLLSDVGILTLAKQSRARAYKSSQTQTLKTAAPARVLFDAETYDNQNEFDSTVKTGTADQDELNKLHDADGGFAESDVGSVVWNTLNHLYATVTAFVDDGELTLDGDACPGGNENYKLYKSRFTAKEAGYYPVSMLALWITAVADTRYDILLEKNGASILQDIRQASCVENLSVGCSDIVYLAANDYLDVIAEQRSGGDDVIHNSSTNTFFAIHKLS